MKTNDYLFNLKNSKDLKVVREISIVELQDIKESLVSYDYDVFDISPLEIKATKRYDCFLSTITVIDKGDFRWCIDEEEVNDNSKNKPKEGPLHKILKRANRYLEVRLENSK